MNKHLATYLKFEINKNQPAGNVFQIEGVHNQEDNDTRLSK